MLSQVLESKTIMHFINNWSCYIDGMRATSEFTSVKYFPRFQKTGALYLRVFGVWEMPQLIDYRSPFSGACVLLYLLRVWYLSKQVSRHIAFRHCLHSNAVCFPVVVPLGRYKRHNLASDFYTPRNEVRGGGGILESPCPSVHPSVCRRAVR